MARPERMGASQSAVSYRGLRDWIEQVEKLGELQKVDGAHWDREMGAVTQMLTEGGKGKAPAILFDEVPGYPKGYRTLYGQFSTIKRVALTLGTTPRIRAQSRHRQGLPSRHDRHEDAQAQNGQDRADLRERAGRRQSRRAQVSRADSPPARHRTVISAPPTCVITKDPDADWYQLRRLSLRSLRRQNHRLPDHRRQARPDSSRQIFRARPKMKVRHRLRSGSAALFALGQPAAVRSLRVSTSPAACAANRSKSSRARFTGFPIPADAEIVIEGEAVPGQSKPEGPVRRMDGLLFRRRRAAALSRRENVMYRNDPILTCAPQHKPVDETGLLKGIAGAAEDVEGARIVRLARYSRRLEP